MLFSKDNQINERPKIEYVEHTILCRDLSYVVEFQNILDLMKGIIDLGSHSYSGDCTVMRYKIPEKKLFNLEMVLNMRGLTLKRCSPYSCYYELVKLKEKSKNLRRDR